MKSAGCQCEIEQPHTSPASPQNASVARPAKSQVPFFHLLALTLALSIGGMIEAFRLASLRNLEIWRHLRVGSWILEKIAIPHLGLFSQSSHLIWRDTNWGYDLLTAIGYRILDLTLLPVQLMFFRFLLAVVAFLLAGGRRHFWRGICFALAAQYILGGLGPEPEFCSVLLFGVALLLLSGIGQGRNTRLLYALPCLFLIWANLDDGVVYGIAAYGLFFLAHVVAQKTRHANWSYLTQSLATIPIEKSATMGIASIMASLLNPYGYYPYILFFENQRDAVNVNLVGHGAMSFHDPRDYAFLLLTMAAFVVLGRQRSFSLFPICLLVGSMVFAFRSERCVGLAAMASIAVIGQMDATGGSVAVTCNKQAWPWKWVGSAVAVAAVLSCAFLLVRVPHGHQALMARVARHFPESACDYIRQHNLPKPLFNSQKWGSFLMWYLPEYPVAIDGRRGLYSEQDENDYSKAMKADIPYQVYAPMRQAQTLLLEKASLMGEALRDVNGFQLVYEDDLAVVLLQQGREERPSSSQ